MICAACKAGQHPECPGTTWCDCQHAVRLDGSISVVLGVHAPECTCAETETPDGSEFKSPESGCPQHGRKWRWVGARTKE